MREARLGLDGQVAQAIHHSRMKPNSAHLETNFIARQTELVNAMEAALASIRYQAGGSPWPRAACLTDKAIFYIQQMTVAHKQARELYDENITQQVYGQVATGLHSGRIHAGGDLDCPAGSALLRGSHSWSSGDWDADRAKTRD